MNPERSERIEIPVLPLRDVVVYPHMVIPLFVGREKSIRCLEAAMDHDKKSCWSPRKKHQRMSRV
ncbi:ATP-dependent protease La [Citrobacter koseri]|uniref:ATP-dependent protease La n=1 Tax=Citrobacter koseri TaxID=545 RepID=A0A2X2V4Z7_CITKO|nr:ATP-dependent protease La [Citrobacter koseri]